MGVDIASDVAKLKQHIINNGAKLGEISNKTFNHTFSLNVLWSPSLWFTSSSVGLGDKGVTLSQKTFKTSDNIFLPYEKVYFAASAKKWYQFSSKLFIFGEQNIVPLRRFKTDDAKRIVEELRERGVGKVEGASFSESYHSSAFGVIFSVLTLGIWHLITVLFSKERNTLVVGEDKFVWNGNIWLMNLEKNERVKNKDNQKFLAGNIQGIKDVYFYKKKWYHLWGTLFIWTHPDNIRTLAYEGSQDSQDYDIEMGKIYSCTAKNILKALEEGGFQKDSSLRKLYKKWVKHTIAQK